MGNPIILSWRFDTAKTRIGNLTVPPTDFRWAKDVEILKVGLYGRTKRVDRRLQRVQSAPRTHSDLLSSPNSPVVSHEPRQRLARIGTHNSKRGPKERTY